MTKLLTAICLFSILFSSCILFGRETELDGNFWALNFVNERHYRVHADKLAYNDLVEIWVQRGSDVTQAEAQKVADFYYDYVYPRMRDSFFWTKNINGRYMDPMQFANFLLGNDGSARLTILLFDIIDGFVPGGGFIGGYFTSNDFFTNNRHSNSRAMVYVDIYPLEINSPEFFRVIAHEFMHLIVFLTDNLYLAGNPPRRTHATELWINEGLAESAEWVVTGKKNHSRISWFNRDLTGYISQGDNFFVWNNYRHDPLAVLNDYATVNLFFQWLRLQTDNDIFKRILTAPHSNYGAILYALENSQYEHQLTDKSWGDLIKLWYAANYFNRVGVYGYWADYLNIVLRAPLPLIINTITDSRYVNLFPGEGIFSRLSGESFFPSTDGNIRHISLNSQSIDTTFNYNSNTLLTLNINTNINAGVQQGLTTGEG
ncbi:MAG: hypothetical protein FWC97_07640, partial [Treponema sp.]|nr:hypothetical protein [Treponema sp.]